MQTYPLPPAMMSAEAPPKPGASVIANPSPTEPATPTTSPSATPSVVDRVLAALDEVDGAIADATGNVGLKGKERNKLAGDVRSAHESGDLGMARAATESLVDKIEDLDDELDEERARRLADAVAAHVEILGGD